MGWPVETVGVFPHPGRAAGWGVLVGLWCVLPLGLVAVWGFGAVGLVVFVGVWLVGLVVGERVTRPPRPGRVPYWT